LSELHRFTDPVEAATTLALRDGRPEALGFYLDRRRVHVGDPTTTLDAVFNACQNDRSHGLDAIMLAPTRELVRSLNQRARDDRLAGAIPGLDVELADGPLVADPGSAGPTDAEPGRRNHQGRPVDQAHDRDLTRPAATAAALDAASRVRTEPLKPRLPIGNWARAHHRAQGPPLANAGRWVAATSPIATPSSKGWRVRACLPS